MGKEDIVIAVHCDKNIKAENRDTLFSFSNGLLKGFNEIGVKAYSTEECNEKNIPFNLAIGFDYSCIEQWQRILSSNVTNIMWSLNSVFADNFKAVEQFSSFDKFVLFEVTPADQHALTTYLPVLKHGYIPQATDMELWKKRDVTKENDIVYFSSMIDYESKILELKATMPELVFNLMMQIYEITLKNPNLTFWQIYQVLKDSYQLELDIEQYLLLFQNVSLIAMYEQKAKMVQALSDFDLKIYGTGPWQKYIKGNVKYMGECDIKESVDIMNKSKISLHCHPMQLGLGIHEIILNASAVETFSLVSDSPSLKAEFNNSLGYFNHFTFDDIAQQADYYLKNEEVRQEKANKAREITANKHTWACRAKSIMEIVD